MKKSENVLRPDSLIKRCLALIAFKATLDDVKAQERAFKEEFSSSYANELVALESALDRTDDPAEEERLKKTFIAVVVLLMGNELKKRGTLAARSGWREEIVQPMSDKPTIDLDAVILELEGNWQEATLMGFLPRLASAAEYRGDGKIIDRFAAVGSYGMMFAGMVWAAYWTSYVRSGSEDTLYLWDGVTDQVTCPTCDERIGNIYRVSELPGIPGDRSTECNGNCRCWLQDLDMFGSWNFQEMMIRGNYGSKNKAVDGGQSATTCGELDGDRNRGVCSCGK